MTWFKRFIVAPLGRACRWLGARGRITVPLRAAWIIFVYYVSIVLVLLTLGAHQLQSELTAEFDPRDGDTTASNAEQRRILGLGDLLAQSLQLRSLEMSLLGAQRSAALARERLDLARSKLSIAQDAFTQARTSFDQAIAAFCGKLTVGAATMEECFGTLRDLGVMPPPSAGPMQSEPPGQPGSSASAIAEQPDVATLIQPVIDAQQMFIAAVNGLGAANENVQIADDDLKANEEASGLALTAYRTFATSFIDSSLTAMEQVNSFVGLGPLTLGFVNPAGVLGIHPTVLTLVLTLVMGVLGTTISVTSQFFKAPREKSLAWYVFRPGLGMVTALAIYVAFRAGQMGLTGGDNDSELNPFVISFFAIAAGLVSEEAIEQLSRLGRGLFGAKAPVGDAVLAKDLGAALTAKGTTPGDLAQELGTTSEQVESWIARDERVPLREQRRIADLLGRPPGELFEPLT